MSHHFRTRQFDFGSFFFSGLTGLATLLILAILAVILGNIIVNGWPNLTWHFVSTIPKKDFFDPATTGVLPMIIGTTKRNARLITQTMPPTMSLAPMS